MKPALIAEFVKFSHSLVGRVASALLALGIALLSGSMILAAKGSDPRMIAKLGDAADPSWTGLLGGATQITSAGALLGFGVVLGWMFGREFAEGTITGLFALPVSRATISAAKLGIYFIWATLTSAGVVCALLGVGLALGFGGPDAGVLAGLWRQFVLGVLTAVIATPVAWVTTVTRSVLMGVVAAIGLVIAAQVAVIGGVGAWSGVATPALWALSRDVGATHLVAVLPIAVAAVALTTWSWARLQLDR